MEPNGRVTCTKCPAGQKPFFFGRSGVKCGLVDTSNTYMGVFDLVLVKVMFGSFGAHVSKWSVTGIGWHMGLMGYLLGSFGIHLSK